jgi:NAD(P)-dependent dehydrogenase (short-subunit alcohol dehydrogenase family)
MASLIGLLRLFKLPFIYLSLPPPDTFKDQTILTTGANAGVGFEAARHFAHLGASRIILGVRSLEKGQAARESISSTSPATAINVWEVDLDNFASVKAFAARCEELPRLDVAIMNAGMATSEGKVSPDGWERLLQVNVLSTALLSCLLLPQLVKSAKAYPETQPHLVVVSSDTHIQAKLAERNQSNILESLNTEASFKAAPFDRYCVSKLFDAYIAIELADLIPQIDGKPVVTVNYVTPGFCKSEFLKKVGEPPLVLRILEKLLARTPEYGALCYVDAAHKGVESHGKYLNHQKVYPYVKRGSLGSCQG